MLLNLKDKIKKNYSFSFDLNIFFLLFIVNFLSYSVYAVLSKYNIVIIELIININLIIFFYLYKKYPNQNLFFKIKIEFYEIIFFLCLSLILILLLLRELNMPLFVDEIAYSRRSTRTSIFTSIIFLNYIDMDFLKITPIKYVIYFFNFLQLIFVCLLFFIVKKKKNFKILFLMLIISIILRLALKDAIPHPPLNHIFSTFLVSLFGLSHLVFRLSYLLPYILFLFFLFLIIKEKIGQKSSMILITSISTFPLLLLSSVVPDHSLWGSLIFIFILFYIVVNEDIDYNLIFLIISIGILFRISVFSAFSLLLACFIFDTYRKKFSFKKKTSLLIFNQKLPIIALVFLPILSVSLLGTPAYEGINEINFVERVYDIFSSNIILFAYLKQIPPWYYLFIIFCFFSIRRFEIFIFLIFNIFIYFSIDKGLWGMPKYTIEYVIPFVLIGHFIFIKFLIDKKKFLLANLINVLIIVLNINDIYNFPKSNTSFDIIHDNNFLSINSDYSKKTKYVLKIPYRYDEAYAYISKNQIKENTLMLGTDYGFLPQIIENYNFRELKNLIELKNKYEYLVENQTSSNNNKLNQILKIKKNSKREKSHSSDLMKSINSVDNLNYILLANYNLINRNDFINLLISENWIIKKKFIDEHYRTTLLLFEKK